ncbi:DUF1772 domain-containing protein [Pseudomonas fontis]|uniref:DUF1772 domain-containing protein n=1 Tax=Pseudomonas fontis TaxID=2942633 RepID=A0ABT5NMG0_9PSED|nr:anthrone oxygenase family protein [Pseudomonas fontis]MDD0976641.1 DUF1772 domain-containing protein [Pseudomonas fontis]MDD0988989.1 DUF1772 domain-containing protein [Pseudomonas fontis]
MPTLETLLLLLVVLAALGCALVGGLFFAFSNFVMQALARVPEAAGIAAMQAINISVLNRLFLGIFMGTAVLCVALIIVAASRWAAPGSLCLALAGGLYLLGNLGVTMLFNVPKNEALARLDAADPGAATSAAGAAGTTCARSPPWPPQRC